MSTSKTHFINNYFYTSVQQLANPFNKKRTIVSKLLDHSRMSISEDSVKIGEGGDEQIEGKVMNRIRYYIVYLTILPLLKVDQC